MSKLVILALTLFSLTINALHAGEVRITGQGFLISDGSITPNGTRGTDFGGFPVASTQLTHTFVIHNDAAPP